MYDKIKLKRFYSSFSNFEQTVLTGFVNSLSISKSDVFLVMARKAACLIEALIELGVLNLNGKVYSERILDMNEDILSDIFRDKNVTIVDDTIVSGTTISDIIKDVMAYGAKSVTIEVITVNKAWYTPQLIEARCNINTNSNVGVTYSKPVELSDNDSVRFCYDIVKGLSVIPKLYDYDFPRIKLQKWKHQSIFSTFSNDLDWGYFDTATQFQIENGVFSYTCIPKEHILKDFDKKFNTNISQIANFKIRFLGNKTEQNNFNLTAIPMTIFNAISKEDIVKFFDILIKECPSKDLITKLFTAYESKLRIIQYVLSIKFMLFWMENIRQKTNKSGIATIRSFVDDNIEIMLFTEQANEYLKNIDYTQNLNYKFCTKPINIQGKISSRLDNFYDDHIIKSKLIEPFIDFYDDKEIPCRKAVKEYDYSNFSDNEFVKYLNDIKGVEYCRLKHGITFPELCERISYLSNFYNHITFTSVFLDKLIARGIAVPIIQSDEEYLYRAYRHGEDAIMGDMDHRMITWILKSICEISHTKKLTKIATEKLIALIIKFGVRKGWIDALVNDNQTIDEHKIVISNRHDLHGMRAKVTQQNKLMLYEEPWYTYFLKKEGYLIESDEGGYQFKPPENFNPLDFYNGASDIKSFAIVFGKIFENQTSSGSKTKTDTLEWQLTKLASCIHPKDVIDALVTEIEIFRDAWERLKSNNFYNYWQSEDFKKAEIAINSGQIKFYAYLHNEAKSIIEDLKEKFTDELYKNILDSFFDLRESEAGQIHHENIINILGCWLITMNLAIRLLKLSYFLNKQSIYDLSSKQCYENILNFFNNTIQRKNKDRLNKLYFYDIVKKYDEVLINKDIFIVLSDIFNYIDKIVPMLDGYNLPKELIDYIGQFLRNKYNGFQLHKYIVSVITTLNYKISSHIDFANWEVKNFNENAKRQMYKNCIYIKLYQHNEAIFKIISKFLDENTLIQEDGFPLVVQSEDSIFNTNNDVCIAYREPQQTAPKSMRDKVVGLISRFKYYIDDIEKIFIIQNMNQKYCMEVIKNNITPKNLVHAHNVIDLIDGLGLNDKKIFEITFSNSARLGINNILGRIELKKGIKKHYEGDEMNYIEYNKCKPKNSQVKIGIITALPEEYNAVCKLLLDACEVCISNRGAGHRYFIGTMPAAFGKYHTVAVCCCGKGNNMSGIQSTEMIMDFKNLKYIIMTGIAAGAPQSNNPDHHVRLGDVVISDKEGVIQYDMIKITDDGIEPRHISMNSSSRLMEASSKFIQNYKEYFNSLILAERPHCDTDILQDASGNVILHPLQPQRIPDFPFIHIGSIGSANLLLKYAKYRDELISKFNVRAFEMEGSGVADAAWQGEVGYLIVRGICDYGDVNKNDIWHEYASAVAAAATRGILSELSCN